MFHTQFCLIWAGCIIAMLELIIPVSIAIIVARIINHMMINHRKKYDCPLEPHDYHIKNGGNGSPMHFYEYACSSCGKRFYI